MNAEQFKNAQGCATMVFQQGEQLGAGIDAVRSSACFDQAGPGVVYVYGLIAMLA
jgi:hypothetical protein